MRKYTANELLEVPRMEVFERAIRYLGTTAEYSCIALVHAVCKSVGTQPTPSDLERACQLYKQQYEKFCSNNGTAWPDWWDSPYPARSERIAAIKAFAKACGYNIE